MRCKVCCREAVRDDFCAFHKLACEGVVEGFSVWQRATDVVWSQYLVEIQKNSLTGEWAKEVAKYLFEEENRDGKQN